MNSGVAPTTRRQKRAPIKVAAFTCGRSVPSARLRVRQHIPALRNDGIETREYYPSTGSAHPTTGGVARIPWLFSQLWQRYWQIKHVHSHDVSILQRQLIATINTFESRIAAPRILDVDDAIWLTCRFNSVDRLARSCDAVVCGNDFIAEHFERIHPRIYVIPTAVDTDAWMPSTRDYRNIHPTIGWIGTRGNFKYLYAIEESLLDVLRECQDARVLIVSDAKPQFAKLPSSRVIFRPWSEETEVHDVQTMSLGIMPLTDSVWERGKCSCKLLQYMACGVPAVASPVGTNVQVSAQGGAILAGSPTQWTEAMLHLLRHPSAGLAIGEAGRSVAVRHYSSATIASKLATVIRRFV